MFVIDAPTVRDCESGIRLEAVISINGKSSIAWFEVGPEYGELLTSDRADAFLVAFFFYALTLGLDVQVNAPVSESLLYQIDSTLIDFLVSIYPEKAYRPIRISAASLAAPVASRGAVGTGVSCGIDSLATIFRHYQHSCPSMRLTHLCFFNTGSHGRPGEKKMDGLLNARRKLAEGFSREIDLPLVEVRSNMSELMPLAFGLTHTYLNAAAALALQPLFATYYYSSGATILEFLEDPLDPCYFDTYLLPLVSTRSLRLYSVEENLGRYEKTRIVASNSLSRRFLNVCNDQAHNCGRCNKCIRSLLALDALGVVNEFNEVFDLKKYRQFRNRHLTYHVKRLLKKDSYHLNLHPYISKQLNLSHQIHGRFQYLLGRIGSLFRSISGRQRS
jgi:hypothetical protein